ncbi:MAG TPA: tRNA lysidine(34) synthetase TilS [Thermoguttaceae bacterium]|nr:tRNA lysidine(34) synthetase TilS [Thermoguttaceae bacterium]
MATSHKFDFENDFAIAWPPRAWQDVTVLLAVSGGADSVAMLRVVHALKTAGEGRVCVAHYNHQLRGEESVADEAFVVGLARRWGLECEVARATREELMTNSGDGLEAAAREARYAFLQQTAARLGARYVVTAHTADDQAETILHRILRGTGIGGLAGMARARPLGPAATLIRPLLTFRRKELVAYLRSLEQPYRHDSSNDETRFTRNRIRHDLLPMLAEQFNPNVVDALLRLGTLAGEAQSVIEAIVDDLIERHVKSTPSDTLTIDAAVATAQPRYVLRELMMALWRSQRWPMQAMGYAQWDELADLLIACAADAPDSKSKKTFPGPVIAEQVGKELRLLAG